MSIEIKIPDLGENITGGRVVSIMAAKGDSIEIDQPLLELETDKAVIEMPSPTSGTISEIKISEGDDVIIGQLVCLLEEAADDQPGSNAEDPETTEHLEAEKQQSEQQTKPQVEPVTKTDTVNEAAPTASEALDFVPANRDNQAMVPAAPSVRRFAREIGIDLVKVPGSGPAGRISIDDVKRFSKQLNLQGMAQTSSLGGIPSEPLPDFSKFGTIERKKMSKLRETAAKHLSYAWATIPHVTQFDKADISELENMRKQYAPVVEKAGGKLTVTAILIKVIEKALKKFPEFNASVDLQNTEVIYKNYFNIGIAVDTEHGLLVPVVKDVDQKNITDLAVELAGISLKSRDRKLSIEDMQGGNFSISNLGGIGGTGFTPVVNSPEVAILGVSRSEMQPVYQDGSFVPRLMMPLSLSYDHRIIDGAAAARFLRWVCTALEQPFLLALEG